MAKKLTKSPKKSVRSYPWDTWTDGSWWEVKTSEVAATFRNQLYTRAASKGLSVETTAGKGTLSFRFNKAK